MVCKLPAFLAAAPLPLRPPRHKLAPSPPSSSPSRRRAHAPAAQQQQQQQQPTATAAPRPAPPSLPNARDLASAAPTQLRHGRLYRGSTPAVLPCPAPGDASAFLRDAAVLLDLRSRDERRTDPSPATLAAACGPDFGQRERHIGLLNKRRVVLGLARVLPPGQARGLAARVLADPFAARAAITRRVDDGGLLLLNRILVEAGSRSIGVALDAVTDGLARSDDALVYFYCSAGKDRTGLLAALILSVLGVPERAIIHDYAKSSECWENGSYQLRKDYCARLEHAGLTPLNWLGASPDIMEQTLDFIRARYGSIEDYLIHCNFPERRMTRLRDSMLISP